HARDRHGRVHDREPLGLQDVPDVHPVHRRDAAVRGGGTLAAQFPDRLGGDARPPVRGPRSPEGRTSGWGALMAYLELNDLRRSCAAVVARNGITAALEQGESLSLLGPPGCGKPPPLRLVPGFDRPNAGTIVVDGKDITRLSPNRRDMGMVFQAYSLFPNMTAEQNVEFGLRIRKNKRGVRRTRVRDLP